MGISSQSFNQLPVSAGGVSGSVQMEKHIMRFKGKYSEVDKTLPFRVVAMPCRNNQYSEVTCYAFELAEDAVRCCQWCNDTTSGTYFIGGPLSSKQMTELEDAGYY